jgi:hypothetical protein
MRIEGYFSAGHIQRADAFRLRASERVRLDKRVAGALSIGATYSDERVRPDPSLV